MPSCGGIFDVESKQKRLAEVAKLAEDPSIWSDGKRAQELGRERKTLEGLVVAMGKLDRDLHDTAELFTMARADNDDASLRVIDADALALEETVAGMEFRRMFANPVDPNNCFLDIQAGSGGTEAQDWAQMLERMYLRYCEKKGFRVELLEESPGEVAGIKSASLKVTGDYSYGHLRTETGVHRLVRKSPFDANNRRHTSFASVFVYPEVDETIDIEINPADLRIDTFRASGAGGQHVNKTDSAIRITHSPTGIVVQCQNDRSQHRNRAEAMAMLRSRLFDLEIRKRNEEKQAMEDSKTDIAWGHQIRSYVLDQSRIKDLRTQVESGNTQAVLDGGLDDFITASLKKGI
jgi:peptide chain release factor 2